MPESATAARPRPRRVRLHPGQTCPLCREGLAGELDVGVCEGCETLLHVACAAEMGGCATMGCGGPRAAAPEARATRLSWRVAAVVALPGSVLAWALYSLVWLWQMASPGAALAVAFIYAMVACLATLVYRFRDQPAD